jgi:hypothetical protein
MNTVLKTLGIIALVVLTAQTIRHGYLLWFEPQGSALDKYDEPMKDEISAAASLTELVAKYDEVRRQVDQIKAERKSTVREEDAPYRFEALDEEPFRSEVSLRRAIQDWEAKAKELHSLRFYWLVGFCVLLAGVAIFRWLNRWAGLALEIAAFSEFIYWTSPTFFGGGGQEFEKLLMNKLVFSLLSLALLIGIAWVQRAFGDGWPARNTEAAS